MNELRKFVAFEFDEQDAMGWAYRHHRRALLGLPDAVRMHIDWRAVAERLRREFSNGVDEGVIESVQAVVNYLYADEQSRFDVAPEDERKDNIFSKLEVLDFWLQQLSELRKD